MDYGKCCWANVLTKCAKIWAYSYDLSKKEVKKSAQTKVRRKNVQRLTYLVDMEKQKPRSLLSRYDPAIAISHVVKLVLAHVVNDPLMFSNLFFPSGPSTLHVLLTHSDQRLLETLAPLSLPLLLSIF
jgi:hypothetical protein